MPFCRKCRGVNPECAYCGGTGWSAGVASGPPAPPLPPEAMPGRAAEPTPLPDGLEPIVQRRRCRFCHATVFADQLLQHQASCGSDVVRCARCKQAMARREWVTHRQMCRQPFPKISIAGRVPENTDRVPCPMCKALVGKGNLHKHKSTRCPKRAAAARPTAKATKPAAEREVGTQRTTPHAPRFTSCPMCNAPVGKKKLEKHMSTRCPKRPKAGEPAVKIPVGKSSSAKAPVSAIARELERLRTTPPAPLHTTCPGCGARVKSKNLADHRSNKCVNPRPARRLPASNTQLKSQFPDGASGKAVTTAPRAGLVRCEGCGARVKPGRLKKHREKRCPAR